MSPAWPLLSLPVAAPAAPGPEALAKLLQSCAAAVAEARFGVHLVSPMPSSINACARYVYVPGACCLINLCCNPVKGIWFFKHSPGSLHACKRFALLHMQGPGGSAELPAQEQGCRAAEGERQQRRCWEATRSSHRAGGKRAAERGQPAA